MLYRFHADVPLPAREVAARIRAMTRESRGSLDSWEVDFSSESSRVPFIGKVSDEKFRITPRHFRYRNKFRPLVWGRIVPAPVGSQVRVTMFLRPGVAWFVLFVLAFAGIGAGTFLVGPEPSDANVLILMFVVVLGLGLAGFIPEVRKAKRLLLEGLSG
jgi:hypothetical protein